jgi:hypothetical protein
MQAQVYLPCVYDTRIDASGNPVVAAEPSAAGPASILRTNSGLHAATVVPNSMRTASADVQISVATTGEQAQPAADGTCGALIDEADILNVLKDSPEDLDRYRRFKASADNPDTRICPFPRTWFSIHVL